MSTEPQTDTAPSLAHPAPLKVILGVVSKVFEVSLLELTGHRRDHRIMNARHTAIHLMANLTQASCNRIGRALGYRDHSTVLHALKNFSRRQERFPDIAEKLSVCEAEILAQFSEWSPDPEIRARRALSVPIAIDPPETPEPPPAVKSVVLRPSSWGDTAEDVEMRRMIQAGFEKAISIAKRALAEAGG